MPVFRGRRPSAAAVVGSVVVAVPLLLVGITGQGNPVGELHQETGTVWISSPDQGLLSLIDGSSQEVAASLRVAVPVGALDVTQAGAAAYVTDVAAGTVTRVDGSTYEATPPFLLGTPGGGTAVLTGCAARDSVSPVRRVVGSRRVAVRCAASTTNTASPPVSTAVPPPGVPSRNGGVASYVEPSTRVTVPAATSVT